MIRRELKVINPYVTVDECKGHESLTIHFKVIQGYLLRSTKEYSLTYIPKTNEWLGNVIAYGQWWDLELDEIEFLRASYGLDTLIQITLLSSTM